MGLSKLTGIAVSLAFTAVLSGKLPWVLHQVRVAQIMLFKESQASKWGKAITLPSK